MRKQSIAAFAVCLFATIFVIAPPAGAADLKDVIGSYHHSPKYTFVRPWPPTDGSKRDILNEGADELLAMGGRVIRIILHPNGVAFYPQTANPAFPVNALFSNPPETRLTETAKTPQYDTLFRKNFSTFIITVMSNVPKLNAQGGEEVAYFGFCGADASGAPVLDGMTAAEVTTERTAIKNLAVYLLTTFNGTNKKFIIATGEGDWIAREPYWGDNSFKITPTRAQAMKDWINARADGVTDARALVPNSTAKVYTDAESNFLQEAIDNSEITMTNDVIPYTRADLYSYTAYGTGNDPAKLVTFLDYLKAKAPDSPTFGANDIFVGEYGVAETSEYGGNGEAVKEVLRRMTETSISWGARYVILWELYDSSILQQYLPPSGEWDLSVTPQPYQMSGYWLRRPDGTYPPIYGYYQSEAGMTATPIALQCYGGGYVTAAGDGGGVVYGNSPHVLGWEELTIIDNNGGALNSGDYVNIMTRNGHFFMAADNGGSGLDSSSTHPLAWETFRIWRVSGTGPITNGTAVAFQAGSGHYVVAEEGGAPKSVYVDLINANRTAIGPWETFTFITR